MPTLTPGVRNEPHTRALPSAVAKGALAMGATSLLAMVLLNEPALALSCPVAHPTTTKAALKETRTQIQELSRLLAAQGTGAIPGIVARLKRRHPRATDAEITNYLVTLYCPVINGNAGLSETAKRSRLASFSTRMTQELMRR